jgi:hypothetical protein
LGRQATSPQSKPDGSCFLGETMGKVFEGDLTVKAGEVYPYEKVTGSIDASGADTKAAFPKLTSVGGYIDASGADTKAAFPKLTSVGGYIDAIGADTKAAFPKLTSVGGSIYASGADTKAAFPKLMSVGGSIYARGADTKAAFPKLTSVGGSIYASGADTKAAFPKLMSVGGYIDASGADTKAAFPKLTSVGGSIYASGADTKAAFPKLTSVGGSIYAIGADTKAAFPKLMSVGGYIDASGADTKAAFPKLTSVGGSIYARGDWSRVKDGDESAAQRCRALLLSSFAAAGFSFADGILARIMSKRGPVSRVVVCGQTEVSYLVTDGEAFSHGKTLKEARDGLLFKIGKRDPSEFKAWTLDKVVPKRDAIRAYRIITGACEGGVRAWMEQRKTPDKITVKGIIELTEGAYGAEAFRGFFEKVPVHG